ncbi:MAG: hypothetical protein JWN44_3591 [Myxococcales bacterium]|nr:hypothetical protein [Myxococcales bacterium]
MMIRFDRVLLGVGGLSLSDNLTTSAIAKAPGHH